ncbi:MAG TPA: rRNA maturation RNase YbeY [Alphaproteobacteria bacterium]|nr:rRNA maturation RNase YbeY [Rhodospirillaceae bacterium]HRJ11929.1 rRNA maturation RNase YbeY [Alphaproteobacteria bacterium]
MPLKINIDVDTASKRWNAADIRAIKRGINTILEQEIHKIKRKIQVSVLLTTNEEVQTLNKKWRDKNKPTNILSFPSNALQNLSDYPAELPLGDLVLAFETCADEAKAMNIKFAHHITHLAIHGTLHLLGHDHETDAAHEAMMKSELEAMAQLGLANPYPIMDNR